MHASSNLTHGIPRIGASLVLLVLGCWGILAAVRVMPDVMRQLARPCSGCALDVFAPPLEPYGFAFRDTAAGGMPPPPVTSVVTVTPRSQPGGSLRWLGPNGRIGLDRTPLAGAGLRYAWTANRFAPDSAGLGGMDGDPAVRNSWSAGPIWSLADDRSSTPPASGTTQFAGIMISVDSVFQSSPIGPGARTRSNDGGRAYDVLPAADAMPRIEGTPPPWRVAVQEDLQRHFVQIGTYEVDAKVTPDDSQSAGTSGTFTDMGADANYQFIINPESPVSDRLSAQATVVHEALTIGAGNRATGFNTLDAFRAGAAWSIAGTVTPSIQYFRTAGSVGAFQYAWSNGRPNSAGVIAQVAYVPWSMSESPMQFLNLRLSAQYVTYTELSGIGRGPNANNAVYLSLWGALRF